MKSFQTLDDCMGRRTDVLNVSDTRHAVVLTAGVPKTVTVPVTAVRVLFAGTGNYWVAYDTAAALPTGDVLNGQAPELNPGGRDIAGVTSLGLVAPKDCLVNLSFYR